MKKIGRYEFLENRDETGNLIVDMLDGTGQSYFVEFISPRNQEKTGWGDVNPATGKVEGSYGGKFKGSIKAEDSVLTPENGFPDAKVIPGGSYMYSVAKKHEAWRLANGLSV